MYKPASSKPTKSGVYPVRVTVMRPVGGDEEEPFSIVEGFAYWDNAVKRWGANRPTVKEALKEKWTCGYRYNTEQKKEWRDERKK